MAGKESKRESSGSTVVISKKQRRTITLQVKLDVIKRHESGQRPVDISRVYSLFPNTVRSIIKDSFKIKEFSKTAAASPNTLIIRNNSGIMATMEKLLCDWIENLHENQKSVTKAMVIEKAKSLFEDLKQYSGENSSMDSFIASNGWFENFKKRAAMQNIKVFGEAGGENAKVTKPNLAYDQMAIKMKENYSGDDENDFYMEKGPERICISNENAFTDFDNTEEHQGFMSSNERSSKDDGDPVDVEVELEEGHILPMKVEAMPVSQEPPPPPPRLQPCPFGVPPVQSAYHSSNIEYSNIPSTSSYSVSDSSSAQNQHAYEDPHLSIFLSETRTQNAELRIAMGRLTDKVDAIMTKIDGIPNNLQQSGSFRSMLQKERYEWRKKEERLKREMAIRIAAEEEKYKNLQKENIYLKKKLNYTSYKLTSMQKKRSGGVLTASNISTNMSNILQPKISNEREFEVAVVRKSAERTHMEIASDFHHSKMEEKIESDPHEEISLEEEDLISEKSCVPKTKSKSDVTKIHLPKRISPDREPVATVSGIGSLDADDQISDGNADISDRESPREGYHEPICLVEPFVENQDDSEIKIKEECISLSSSREGSLDRILSPEPTSPPIFDAGELSESGEEWHP